MRPVETRTECCAPCDHTRFVLTASKRATQYVSRFQTAVALRRTKICIFPIFSSRDNNHAFPKLDLSKSTAQRTSLVADVDGRDGAGICDHSHLVDPGLFRPSDVRKVQ